MMQLLILNLSKKIINFSNEKIYIYSNKIVSIASSKIEFVLCSLKSKNSIVLLITSLTTAQGYKREEDSIFTTLVK